MGALRVLRDGTTTVVAVVAIVLASVIGLNAWADEAATSPGSSATGP